MNKSKMNGVAKLLNIKNKKVFTTNEKDGLFYLNKQGIFRHDPKSIVTNTRTHAYTHAL